MRHKTYTKPFDSCVVPITEYCNPVWSHTDFNKIETVQNLATDGATILLSTL